MAWSKLWPVLSAPLPSHLRESPHDRADATVETNEDSEGAEAAATVVPGVEIYQVTDKGVALQATLQGTKYWKNDELN